MRTFPRRTVLGFALAAAVARPDRAAAQGAPDLAAAKAELAGTGVLRAGINLSNFLLVSGSSPSGEPVGVAPDMARAIAERLGVPVKYVTYERPGLLADDAEKNAWD